MEKELKTLYSTREEFRRENPGFIDLGASIHNYETVRTSGLFHNGALYYLRSEDDGRFLLTKMNSLPHTTVVLGENNPEIIIIGKWTVEDGSPIYKVIKEVSQCQ